MNKLYPGIVEGSFGDHSFFYLPKLLNFHGVMPEELRMMRLVGKPHLTKQLLTHFAPSLKSVLKDYLKRHPKSDGGALFRKAYTTLGMEPRLLQDRLSDMAGVAIDRSHLYVEDGVVKSQIAATFSYDTHSLYEAELDLFEELVCPECHYAETLQKGDVPVSFSRLVGPYLRCDQCDSVVRPFRQSADELPDGWGQIGTGEEWDDYKEWLSELVEKLGNHLEAAGLPTPCSLRIDVGNADWRGRDAYAECAFDGKELADKVRVNSDFTISNGKLWLQQVGLGRLTCSMSHHDVPMGSSVTIQPSWECELDGEPLVGEQIFDCIELAKAATHLFAGAEFCFQFNPTAQLRAVSEIGFTESVSWLCAQLGLEEEDPIRVLLETLDFDGKQLATQAKAIRALIDERLAEEQEDAA
jgi:hypothetical protein